MRQDIHQAIVHDDRAENLRRELLRDPHYARLVHPDSGRVLPINRAQGEVIRVMLASGWTLEGRKP